MKITNIKIYRVEFNGDIWVWLSIETNSGLIGWGEVSDSGNDEAVANIINDLSDILIGKDPRNIIECTRESVKFQFPPMRNNRYFSTAWSGIDQALWDISSQYYNVPLYYLLGGFGKNQVSLYANLNRGLRKKRDPESLMESGKKAYSDGFSMVKCTPFDEVIPSNHFSDFEPGLNRLKHLLSVVDISNVSIDFHQRFNEVTLFKLLRVLIELGDPYWIEDILPFEHVEAYSRVRTLYPTMVIGGGETSKSLSELLELINSSKINIILPDVKHVGGVSAIKSIIPLAEVRGVKVSLHNPSGPISAAFSAHLCTLIRDPLPLEYPWKLNCKRAEVSLLAEPIVGGMYNLNETPGIGISPSTNFLNNYGKKWDYGQWKTLVH